MTRGLRAPSPVFPLRTMIWYLPTQSSPWLYRTTMNDGNQFYNQNCSLYVFPAQQALTQTDHISRVLRSDHVHTRGGSFPSLLISFLDYRFCTNVFWSQPQWDLSEVMFPNLALHICGWDCGAQRSLAWGSSPALALPTSLEAEKISTSGCLYPCSKE